MNEIERKDIYIREQVQKNRKSLPENCTALKRAYPGKIRTLSAAVEKYCHQCAEIANHQKMLEELAKDLPHLGNPSGPVRRSIEKRFKVIIKHLQETHGLSTPQQFTEGGIVLGASLLGMAGFVVMAFNMNIIYPLAGLLIGGAVGYVWGKNRDKRAENENTVLEFREKNN